MKTYEDFLLFLEKHLKQMATLVPVTDQDFYPFCTAVSRFLLSEPYRWEKLIEEWPILPEVAKPSQDELLNFFNQTKRLPISFKKELMENDYETLYLAYNLMQPILIRKDEFLTSIFREDIQHHRYKKIFGQSQSKIKRITKTINQMKKNQDFIKLAKQFTTDLSGFSLTLINNQNLLEQALKKMMEDGE